MDKTRIVLIIANIVVALMLVAAIVILSILLINRIIFKTHVEDEFAHNIDQVSQVGDAISHESGKASDMDENIDYNDTNDITDNNDITNNDDITKKPPVLPEDPIYWINGTHAVLTKLNKEDITVFGGGNINSRQESVRRSLERWWSIQDKEKLDDTISRLTNGMHNPRFLDDIFDMGIQDMSRAEFDYILTFLDDEADIAYAESMYGTFKRFGMYSIMAWDLSRATQLCASGYAAGYYTYEEAIEKALDIGVIIQVTFFSWEDFWESYMAGYFYWSKDYEEYQHRWEIIRRLYDDEFSPFHLDWFLRLR